MAGCSTPTAACSTVLVSQLLSQCKWAGCLVSVKCSVLRTAACSGCTPTAGTLHTVLAFPTCERGGSAGQVVSGSPAHPTSSAGAMLSRHVSHENTQTEIMHHGKPQKHRFLDPPGLKNFEPSTTGPASHICLPRSHPDPPPITITILQLNSTALPPPAAKMFRSAVFCLVALALCSAVTAQECGASECQPGVCAKPSSALGGSQGSLCDSFACNHPIRCCCYFSGPVRAVGALPPVSLASYMHNTPTHQLQRATPRLGAVTVDSSDLLLSLLFPPNAPTPNLTARQTHAASLANVSPKGCLKELVNATAGEALSGLITPGQGGWLCVPRA